MALDATSSIPPRTSPVDIDPALIRVRQMDEFAPHEPGPLERLMDLPWVKMMTEKWQAGFQDVLDNLRRLFGQASPGNTPDLPPYLLDVVSTAAGIILVLLGVFAFYLMLGALRRLIPAGEHTGGTINKSFEGMLLVNAEHHRREAGNFARESRMDLAVRELYLALLCLLEERGVLSFEPTRSNAEYLMALSGHHNLSQIFSGLAGLFEASRYGGREVTEAQFRAGEASYTEAHQALTGASSHG